MKTIPFVIGGLLMAIFIAHTAAAGIGEESQVNISIDNDAFEIYLPLVVTEYQSGGNLSPYIPAQPSPGDGETDQSIDVNLSWTGGDPDGDSVTYDVFFEAFDNSPDNLFCNDVSTNACDPSTLQFNTTYYWQVIARDEHDATTTGPVWVFTTGAEPNVPPFEPNNPSPPAGSTDQNVNSVLSWQGGDPNGDNVTYDVLLEAEDSSPDKLICDDINSLNCDPGTLEYNTTYYWQVVARDGHGLFTNGPVWNFVTLNRAPNEPSKPAPSDGATDQGIDVILGWSGGDLDGDRVTYDVYFEAGNSLPENLVCDDVNSNSCNPGTLIYNTQYYWKVVARDEHGVTKSGSVWNFITSNTYMPVAEIVEPGGDAYITRAVEEKDGFAYLLTRDGDLHIYDISDLPSQEGSFVTYNEPIMSSQVETIGNGLLRLGNYLYVYGLMGIQIMDVSNPSSPVIVKSLMDLWVHNVTVHENYLIAVGKRRVAVYSIADIANPELLTVTSFDLPDRTWFAAGVHDNTLYLTELIIGDSNYGGIRIVDFSNPSSLKLIGFLNRTNVPYHFKRVGSQLIDCATNSINLWNLSDPYSPSNIQTVPAKGRACVVENENVITNGKVFRLESNNFQNIATFTHGYIQTDGFPYGSAVNSDFVFIAQSPRVLVLSAEGP